MFARQSLYNHNPRASASFFTSFFSLFYATAGSILAEGIELKSIASIIGKSIKTIENWHYQYVKKGIDSLNSFQYKPKQSYLNSAQIDHVVSWVKETNPGKTKEVREYIKDHFKIVYSNEAVRKLLKKMGLKILRPKVVPGNPPSEEEQKKN